MKALRMFLWDLLNPAPSSPYELDQNGESNIEWACTKLADARGEAHAMACVAEMVERYEVALSEHARIRAEYAARIGANA